LIDLAAGTTGSGIASSCLVDVNLLLWAHHRQFPRHDAARAWWEESLSVGRQIGIPWPTIVAFIRISTDHRVLERPAERDEAAATTQGWLDRPNTWVPVPTDRHSAIFFDLLRSSDSAARHTPDCHLAALAIEWGLELLTADRDFARYPRLQWRNPLDP